MSSQSLTGDAWCHDVACMVPRHTRRSCVWRALPAGRSQSVAGATRNLSTALCVDSSGPQPTPTMRSTLARPPRALQGTRRTFGKLQLLSSSGRSPSSPLACAQARRRDAMQERRCRAPAGRGRCHLAEGCGRPVSTHRTRHRGGLPIALLQQHIFALWCICTHVCRRPAAPCSPVITNGVPRSALKKLAVYGTFEKQLYAVKHDCERRMTAQACPRCVLRRSVFALASWGAVGSGVVQRLLISCLPVHAAACSATETNGASGRRHDNTRPHVAATADSAARLVECLNALRCAPQAVIAPVPAATAVCSRNPAVACIARRRRCCVQA